MSDRQADEGAPHDRVEILPELAHEGRNALQEIQAGLRLLRLVVDSGDETRELLDELAKSASRLKRLFSDLSEYTAPLQAKVEPCDAAEAWRTACARWEIRASERQDESSTVTADPVLLEEAFSRIAECLAGHPPDPDSIDFRCADVEVRGQRMVRITLRDTRSPGERSSRSPGRRHAALSFAIAERLVRAQGGQLLKDVSESVRGISLLLPKAESGSG